MLATAKNALRRLAGRDHPSGKEVAVQIRSRLPNEQIRTVFDVGANVGQSIVSFRKYFPSCHIFSFEPVPETFSKLSAGFANDPDVSLYNFGLGSKQGEVYFQVSEHHDMARISDDPRGQAATIHTLDASFNDFGTKHIDYLKIDTEGHDLEVLRGGAALLKNETIKIIDIECGINKDNQHHVPFHQIHSYLEGLGYRLFHIYEMAPEWPTRSPNLRRVNALFISPSVISRNRW